MALEPREPPLHADHARRLHDQVLTTVEGAGVIASALEHAPLAARRGLRARPSPPHQVCAGCVSTSKRRVGDAAIAVVMRTMPSASSNRATYFSVARAPVAYVPVVSFMSKDVRCVECGRTAHRLVAHACEFVGRRGT